MECFSGIELRANKGARKRKNKDQDKKKPPVDKNRLIRTEGNTVGVGGGKDLQEPGEIAEVLRVVVSLQEDRSLDSLVDHDCLHNSCSSQ